jgi:hypothetical protein
MRRREAAAGGWRRRAGACAALSLAVLGAVSASGPSVIARAATSGGLLTGSHVAPPSVPSVSFKARFLPIMGFPGTGNIYGSGASIALEYAIEGSEYGGYPPPLLGVSLSLPSGTRLRQSGFPTCRPTTSEPPGLEPSACPRGSAAGPVGTAEAVVASGNHRVPEQLALETFFAPGGGLQLLIAGQTPVAREVLAPTRVLDLSGAEGYGPKLVTELPLIETEPGAAYASLERIAIRIGSAYRRLGRATYYVDVPKRGQCPVGGARFKAELTFAGLGAEGRATSDPSREQTVTSIYRAPCPRRERPTPPPVEAAPPVPPPAPPPPVVPATPVSGTGGVVTAPPNAVCLSRRHFTIHVVQIRGVEYRRVEVLVDGRRVKVVRGSAITAPVDLRGLPRGRYTVRITVTTTTGRRITGTRSYRTCAARPLPAHGKSKL